MILSEAILSELRCKGVNILWNPGAVILPTDCTFEPPCALKWMTPVHSLAIGAFSYGVSGYFFACRIGRYTSMGENIQAGRGDHPLDWLSMSPFQYHDVHQIIHVGLDFPGGQQFANLNFASERLSRPPHRIRPIVIGHDVWIGHGAYLKPGISIGNGAVVGAQSVVTKDVPPYAVVAGNPAKIIKMRFDERIIERLMALQWWRFSIWDLKNIQFDRIDSAIDEIQARIDQGIIVPYQPEAFSLVDLSSSDPGPGSTHD